MPVCGFCKSKYLEYKEYHTNADNFKLVTKKGLEESFIVMSNIIQAFENTLYPKTQTLCEPMLSKKNLYPSVSKKDLRETTRINIIAYSDGLNSVFEIALKLKISLSKILEEINILKQSGLIK